MFHSVNGEKEKKGGKMEMVDLEKMHEKDLYPAVETFLATQKNCIAEYVGTELTLKRGKTSLRADVFGVPNQTKAKRPSIYVKGTNKKRIVIALDEIHTITPQAASISICTHSGYKLSSASLPI